MSSAAVASGDRVLASRYTFVANGEAVGSGAGVDDGMSVGVGGEAGAGAGSDGDVVRSVGDRERGVLVAPRTGPDPHRLPVEPQRRRVAFLRYDRQLVAELLPVLQSSCKHASCIHGLSLIHI